MKQATAAKQEEEARKKALLAELDELEQQLQGSKDEEQVRKSRRCRKSTSPPAHR